MGSVCQRLMLKKNARLTKNTKQDQMWKKCEELDYWQPACRWSVLPWWENPDNPAISPQAGEGNRHPSDWINSGKRGGSGGENCMEKIENLKSQILKPSHIQHLPKDCVSWNHCQKETSISLHGY